MTDKDDIRLGNIVPFSCVFIDADLKEILTAIRRCFATERVKSRVRGVKNLVDLFTSKDEHPHHVLPCLCVRSAFDLLLTAADFKSGSEIIISAINIPDMEAIVHHHGLVIVPLDVNVDTLEPRIDLLPELITERTVIILVAHIFGSTFDVTPFINVVQSQNQSILFIEDCAESFSGLDGYLGHPMTDAIFHSFGVIKRRTCFGGAIAKIKNNTLHRRMMDIQDTFPLQTNSDYLEKLVQYAIIYLFLNVPPFTRSLMKLGKWTEFDYQRIIVRTLRSYKEELIKRIRYRPSMALIVTMAERLGEIGASPAVQEEIQRTLEKREYLGTLLPDDVVPVGKKAIVKPNWLYPVLVVNSSKFSDILNHLGIDSYKGTTQLKAFLPAEGTASSCRCIHPSDSSPSTLIASTPRCTFPHSAQHMMDHVVYLPVHANVPQQYLTTIGHAATIASKKCNATRLQNQRNYIAKPKL